MKKIWFTVILAASVASAASAQVSTINSAITTTETRSDPSSTLTVTNNYPAGITISDQNLTQQNGTSFTPNKTDWFFSNDGGATAYKFDNDDYFTTSVTVTLTGSGTSSTRKEAGIMLNTPTDGQGFFIVDTDAHEIASFGGPFPYNGTGNSVFPAIFQSGDTVQLGITYFLDPATNLRSMIFTANDITQNTGTITSPIEALTNTEQGIITGSMLGGYEQTTAVSGQTNGITAVFSNISIAPAPEPSGFVAMLAGALPLGALLLLRRKRATR